MATNSSLKENKKTSSFESALVLATESSIEIVDAKVRFIKPLPNGRVMLLVQRNDKQYKCYGFATMVEGLKAPFNAELLIEQRVKEGTEFWNVTTVTEIAQ
jgi:hypothetical protein